MTSDNPQPAFMAGGETSKQQSTKTANKSFADVLKNSKNYMHQAFSTKSFTRDPCDSSPSLVAPKELSSHRGKPAIIFSTSEVSNLASPFQHTLVGKFSKGRPTVDVIRKFVKTLDFKGQIHVGVLDSRHVLLRSELEVDFLRLWTRTVWNIQGSLMRIFKWTSSFHVDHESSLAPVWITLPKLPIHYFNKDALFAIASMLGRPLLRDAATSSLSRPSVARVLVEIDLTVSLPNTIWIGCEDGSGFWQNIVPEKIPKYCDQCLHMGHDQSSCRLKNEMENNQKSEQDVVSSRAAPMQRQTKDQPGRHYDTTKPRENLGDGKLNNSTTWKLVTQEQNKLKLNDDKAEEVQTRQQQIKGLHQSDQNLKERRNAGVAGEIAGVTSKANKQAEGEHDEQRTGTSGAEAEAHTKHTRGADVSQSTHRQVQGKTQVSLPSQNTNMILHRNGFDSLITNWPRESTSGDNKTKDCGRQNEVEHYNINRSKQKTPTEEMNEVELGEIQITNELDNHDHFNIETAGYIQKTNDQLDKDDSYNIGNEWNEQTAESNGSKNLNASLGGEPTIMLIVSGPMQNNWSSDGNSEACKITVQSLHGNCPEMELVLDESIVRSATKIVEQSTFKAAHVQDMVNSVSRFEVLQDEVVEDLLHEDVGADIEHEMQNIISSTGLSPRKIMRFKGVQSESSRELQIARIHPKRGRVWVFLSAVWSGTVIAQSRQFLAIRVSHNVSDFVCVYVVIHASSLPHDRRLLWTDLLQLCDFGCPVVFAGDFNTIIAPSEKKGGRPFRPSEGREFVQFISSAALLDPGFTGSNFTWCNNRRGRARVWKRLDRVLLSSDWSRFQMITSVQHLSRLGSDHSPLLVSHTETRCGRPRLFRFMNFWAAHPSFLEVVREAWKFSGSARPIMRLFLLLKNLKKTLIAWNKSTFGNVIARARVLEEEVQALELQMEGIQEPPQDLVIHLNLAQAKLKRALALEEQLWRQKSRVRWLRDGDANSAFFHATVREKRAQLGIHRIRLPNNDWIEGDDNIGLAASQFFHNLLSRDTTLAASDVSAIQVIPKLVTSEDNDMLQAIPSSEEIKEAVFDMDADSAAGPDGFTGKFFQVAWDIIAQDVVLAVHDFFNGAEIPKGMAATLLVLIPKSDQPQTFADFRPISLCNFSGKIISKILARRIGRVLPRIISPNQSGFVPGRVLSENVLLAQELCTDMNKKVRGGRVALKLDMAKAYDRVSFGFLIQVMRAFGFGEEWLDRVWRIISSCSFSVLINGSPHGFFQSSRGLRQGDPLSPALFIISAEVLSRSLNGLLQKPEFNPYPVPSHCTPITHLAFADDVLIFSSGFKRSLELVMEAIRRYEEASGQLVNTSKSGLLVSKHLSVSRIRMMERVTGFGKHDFPITYLGCPLYVGRKVSGLFSQLVAKVQARLLGWKNNFLSAGGRIILIKHILMSFPLHILAVLDPPNGVLLELEKSFNSFLWGAHDFGTRYHWVAWSALCFPWQEGGAGLRRLQDITYALSCKLWWNFRVNKSLWAQFMQAKYVHDCHPLDATASITSSHVWRRMVRVREMAEPHVCWDVRLGKTSFWKDNWMRTGALCHYVTEVDNSTIEEFFIRENWDEDRLRMHVPDMLVPQILNQDIVLDHSMDEPMWGLTSSGKFTTASAYEMVRSSKPPTVFGANIGMAQLPLKISFFMLRLWHSRLPVDTILFKFRVFGPSRCCCCANPQVESIDHLFATGQLASGLWSFFEGPLGVNTTTLPVRQRCLKWWQFDGGSGVQRIITRMLPSLLLWFIWRSRNKARFENISITWKSIVAQVMSDMGTLLSIHYPDRQFVLTSWVTLWESAKNQAPVFSARFVKWLIPPWPSLKLNVAGRVRGVPSLGAGGGIMRDWKGQMVLAFHCFFGKVTGTEAGMKALLLGIAIAVSSGLSNFVVESDDETVCKLISNGTFPPWKVLPLLRQLRPLLSVVSQTVHVKREVNSLAGGLVNVGFRLRDFHIYREVNTLPAEATQAYRMDALGLGVFRFSRA